MKKIFLVMLAVVFMLTAFVGCNGDKTSSKDKNSQSDVSSSDKTSSTDKTSSNNNSNDNTANGTTSDNASSGNSGNNSSNGNSGNNTSNGTSSNNNTVSNTKDYGGKKFTICLRDIPTEEFKRTVAAFNQANNANLEIKVEANYDQSIAKSVSSGKPFDIVAYHPTFYSPKFMESYFEPLNSYITASDYSKDKGINKTLTEMFTYKGKIYSAVSSKSVAPYVIYYNKELSKMYYGGVKDYDPYELWKAGKWNFDKLKQLSHASPDSAAFAVIDLKNWLDIKGVNAISRSGDSFSSGLKTSNVKTALNSYKDMFYGSNPMMSNNVSNFNARSLNSTCIYKIGTVSDYEKILKGSNNPYVDTLPESNVGVVPLPEGMYPNGKYPAKIARAYSSAKGASDPSVAAYFALFEGKLESDINNFTAMPAEIYNAVYQQFANGGFAGYNYGFQYADSSATIYIISAGRMIAQGMSVDEAVNEVNELVIESIKAN